MAKKKTTSKKSTKSKSKLDKILASLTPKTASLALVLVLLASTVSVLGYNKVKYGSFTAQAAGYTTIWQSSPNFLKVQACRYSSSGIRARFVNSGGNTQTFQIDGYKTSVGPTRIVYKSVSNYGTSVYGGVVGWGGNTVNKYSIVNC